MGYYEGEKSVGLGPILLTLSLVAVMGFALLYYMYGRTSETTAGQDASTPAQAVQSAQPATPVAQPALAAKAHNPHNHV